MFGSQVMYGCENFDNQRKFSQVKGIVFEKLFEFQIYKVRVNNIQSYKNNQNQQKDMAEESIDFLNLSRKIIINPAVPLQILDIFCRNKMRVQATILGKVYSSSIEVLEIVPDALCDQNEIKIIDFTDLPQAQSYARSLENLQSVYPTLQVLGVAVTDLTVDRNLAKLHTVYSNKQSRFKPQGILGYPIILSIGTKFTNSTKNLDIQAYTYNSTLRIIKDVMDVTSFEKLQVQISFGDSDIQGMVPLYEALNDNQQKWVSESNQQLMIEGLKKNLLALKEKTDNSGYDKLNKKLKKIIDSLSSSEDYSMEDLGYLLDLAGLYKKIALKITKFL